MQSVAATFRNGRIELAEPVDWPEGIQVRVTPLQIPEDSRRARKSPMTEWPEGFFERLAKDWGDEPFERPPQGEFEVREDW
jgi:hypothetical protein